MTLCGSFADFTIDCDNLMKGGTEQDIIIVDYDDVRAELAEGTPGITFDGTTKSLVTDFTFTASSDREGYLIEGSKGTVIGMSEAIDQNSGVGYKHSVEFQIQDNLAASDYIVSQLKNKRIVVIFKNRHKNASGAGKYKILGLESGLVLESSNLNTSENNGVHMLKFSSEEISLEPHPIWSLFDTDEATTDAIWTALQTAA